MKSPEQTQTTDVPTLWFSGEAGKVLLLTRSLATGKETIGLSEFRAAALALTEDPDMSVSEECAEQIPLSRAAKRLIAKLAKLMNDGVEPLTADHVLAAIEEIGT